MTLDEVRRLRGLPRVTVPGITNTKDGSPAVYVPADVLDAVLDVMEEKARSAQCPTCYGQGIVYRPVGACRSVSVECKDCGGTGLKRPELQVERMTKIGEFKMTFGRYNGQTLDAIASTDEGLLYLDRIVDDIRSPVLKRVVVTFLDQPDVQQDIRAALAAKER